LSQFLLDGKAMRVLNVGEYNRPILSKTLSLSSCFPAEKPSVAKEISALLGGSNVSKRSGKSKFNPVFEFPYTLQGRQCEMIFTSVSGHLLAIDFSEPFRKNWRSCSPTDLFHLPVVSFVPDVCLFTKIHNEQQKLILFLG
jgi:DNA topoisomerase IA